MSFTKFLIFRFGIPACSALILTGCVKQRIYNKEQHQHVQRITESTHENVKSDLAIIEFDDHGVLWDVDQLHATLDLIRRRNEESGRGVFVIPFVHGWKNNADPDQDKGDLVKFREELARIAFALGDKAAGKPDHLIGVYLGWRGATSKVPIQKNFTFWDRRNTAERVASLNMREVLYRIMGAARTRPDSKCVVVGHSMGGLILGKVFAPSFATTLLTSGRHGVRMPSDLVLLLNPALDALASWQFVDFLKRSNARVELRRKNGEVDESTGPVLVSITSEADTATGRSYAFGRTLSSWFKSYRTDHVEPQPSQRYLATHAEGHVDYLISHRARVENGDVILERVPGAYNDTPFWIVQVTSDISSSHGDTRNPMLGKLTDQINQMAGVFEIDVQSWVYTD